MISTDSLLNWSDDGIHEDLPIAYGRPSRPPAQTWPLVIPHHTSSRPWVAEITGQDETYRYARVFLQPDRTPAGRLYTLQPSRVYEVSDGEGQRYFIIPPRFEGDKPLTLSPDEVVGLLRFDR